SRRRHTRFSRDWSSDVCSSDLRTRAAHCLQELLRQHPKIRLTGNRVGHERLTGYSLHLVLHGGKIMVESLLRTVRLDRYGSVVGAFSGWYRNQKMQQDSGYNTGQNNNQCLLGRHSTELFETSPGRIIGSLFLFPGLFLRFFFHGRIFGLVLTEFHSASRSYFFVPDKHLSAKYRRLLPNVPPAWPLRAHWLPVEPKPPSPRVLWSNSETTSKSA